MITFEAVGEDLPAVCELFTEPDFYFRTVIPDLLSESEIRALVAADALLCRCGGVPAGLVWLTVPDPGYPTHFALITRFAADCPLPRAVAAVREALSALTSYRPVRRISHEVCAVDRRGIELAEALGLELEGTVPGLLAVAGGHHGIHYYGKLFGDRDG